MKSAEEARLYARNYKRKWRAEHPDRDLRSKILTAKKLLQNNGFTVIKNNQNS